jgi:TRAP-type transport system small permease protein
LILITFLQKITEYVAALLLALIVAVIFTQVVCRYFLAISLSWPEELARYLLVWLVFIGGAAAVGRGEQLVVDTLTELSSHRFKRVVRFIAPVGGLLGVIVLTYSCIPLFGPASRTVSPATDIPLGWIYAALPTGSLLAAIFLIHSLYYAIRYPDLVARDPVEAAIEESTRV